MWNKGVAEVGNEFRSLLLLFFSFSSVFLTHFLTLISRSRHASKDNKDSICLTNNKKDKLSSYSNKSNYVIMDHYVFIFKCFTACSSIFYSFFLPPAVFAWAGFVVWCKEKKIPILFLFFFFFPKRRRTGEIKKLIFLSFS